MREIRPCGSWASPIGSADLVRGALRLSAPRVEGDSLYWLEGRPSEGGRQVVMVASIADPRHPGPAREASPPGVNVRTRVHEYGGGEYTVWRDRIFYVDGGGDRDGAENAGRIHAGRVGGACVPITPAGSWYADLLVSPNGRWLVAVEERPCEGAEPENRLIAIPLRDPTSDSGGVIAGGGEGAEAPRVVAAGHDFYASPCFAPDGERLAFLAWDHPHMPWNETVLEVVGWGTEGPAGPSRRVAGERGESLFQPRFAAAGMLGFVSDRSGWWNLERLSDTGPVPIHSMEAELGRPQWVFGQSTWDFVSDQQVLASATIDGVDSLGRLDLRSGAWRAMSTSFTSISGVTVGDGVFAFLGGSPTRPLALYLGSVDSEGELACIRESAPFEMPEAAISVAEAREIVSTDGRVTHAFVYPPCSETHAGRPGERPPLLVKSHGGPTAATSAAFDPRIQFWTSRGFAVADVNYAGSTGYGRVYRDLLAGSWGQVDVEDCVNVAKALSTEGSVDAERLAISGGSAGGYTTLCALTFFDTFAAGASHYGIGDLEALARDTHKFESRYTDWLVGPLPEARARYVERSPIHHHERLGCPVIFFQGLEDRVVPPNQAEAMVAVLAKRGIPHAYVPFEGEQHGFRRAENIRTALDGELYFYSRIFGFEAPRPLPVVVIGMESHGS